MAIVNTLLGSRGISPDLSIPVDKYLTALRAVFLLSFSIIFLGGLVRFQRLLQAKQTFIDKLENSSLS